MPHIFFKRGTHPPGPTPMGVSVVSFFAYVTCAPTVGVGLPVAIDVDM